MASTRELILVRVECLMKQVFGEDHVMRNVTDFPDTKSKAGICSILEGDEETEETGEGRGRPNSRPVIIVMRPEVFFRLYAEPKDIGAKMTEARDKIINKVMLGSSWVDLLHNGDVRYAGYATSFAAGRALDGTAAVSFAFRYVMRPDSLGQ